MNNKPLISIIVPVYNGERYIRECIESIIDQDYENFELILVDDGSPDKCGIICDEYSKLDKRIKVIHQKNSGVSAARNKALKIIKGDYVTFVDQDDCISQNYLSYLYDLLLNSNADMSAVPKAHRFIGMVDKNKVDISGDMVEIWSGQKAAEQMLYYNIIIGPWNKLISTKLIKKNNILFNEEFFGGEGFSFSVDCFQHSKAVAIGHKEVYLYRVDNPDSGTTKFSEKMMYSNINAQQFIKNNLINPTNEILKACKYSNWHTYCDNLNTIIGCNVKNEYKMLYRDIKKICRRDALVGLSAPISIKEKAKCILYFISPYIASILVNKLRLRKYTKE